MLVVAVSPAEIDEKLRLLEEGSVEEQIEAVRWLGLHRVAAARTPIVELVTGDEVDKRLLTTARLMLELYRHPERLHFETDDEIVAHLDDDDPLVRADALRHVVYFGLDESIPRVARLLADQDTLVREEALTALRRLGDRAHRGQVLPLLEDSQGGVRLRALEYLLALEDPSLLDRIVVVTGDPSPFIATPAARLLARSPDPDAAVLAILRQSERCDEGDRVRRYLLALDRFASPVDWPGDSQQHLIGFLDHEDAGARVAAAALVVAIDAPAAQRTLENALRDPVVEHRLAAARALVDIEAPIRSSDLGHLLGDEDPEVRRAAIDLAGTLPAQKRRRVFLELLQRPGEPDDVRSFVLASFAEVGTDDDVELLLGIARSDGSHSLRINAVSALALLEQRTGSRVGAAWYRQVLGNPDEPEVIKRTVLTAVRLTKDTSFLPLLADQLRAMPSGESDYAEALAETISILLGRQLHSEQTP